MIEAKGFHHNCVRFRKSIVKSFHNTQIHSFLYSFYKYCDFFNWHSIIYKYRKHNSTLCSVILLLTMTRVFRVRTLSGTFFNKFDFFWTSTMDSYGFAFGLFKTQHKLYFLIEMLFFNSYVKSKLGKNIIS